MIWKTGFESGRKVMRSRQEEMEKEANASSLLSNKLTLFLIVFAVILLVICRIFFTNLSYKGGLVGDAFYPVKFWHWIALWVVAWGVLGIVSLVNVIEAVVKLCKRRETRWGRVFAAFLPLLLLYIPFYSYQQTEAGAVYFLRGYEIWVEREVDIPAIQGWLASVPSEYSGKQYYDAEKFPDDLPEAVTKLNPQYIYFSTFENT